MQTQTDPHHGRYPLYPSSYVFDCPCRRNLDSKHAYIDADYTLLVHILPNPSCVLPRFCLDLLDYCASSQSVSPGIPLATLLM